MQIDDEEDDDMIFPQSLYKTHGIKIMDEISGDLKSKNISK